MFRWFVLKLVDHVRKRGPHQKVIRLCNGLLRWSDAYGRLRADLSWRRLFAFYRIGGAENVAQFLREIERTQRYCEKYGHYGVTYGHVLGVQAIYRQEKGELAEAASLYRLALNYLPGRRGVSTRIPLGSLLRELGKLPESREVLIRAMKDARDRRHRICATIELARTMHEEGDRAGAKQFLLTALQQAHRYRFPDEEGDALRQLARIAADMGEFSEARVAAHRAEECYRRAGSVHKAEGAARMWRAELRPHA